MSTILFACLPALVFSVLFVRSYAREPRQFRNALYLLAAVICLLGAGIVLLRDQTWLLLVIFLLIFLFPLVAVVLLTINGVTVVRREGRSVTNALPFMLAAFILVLYVSFPILSGLGEPGWLVALGELFVFEGLWFSFTLVALFLYSWLYRRLPKRRLYDYIVIHGAGLVGDRPSPLLAGRIDKAIELWHDQGGRGAIVVSGGQGPDEVVSEAQAMHGYLVRHGVPETAILDENRSTNTMENLRLSKELMDGRSSGRPYRCAVVTSDFHVFRCVEYARRLGIAADGVGSRTSRWYWPAAFIREFVAITREHYSPYVVIACLWALVTLMRLL